MRQVKIIITNQKGGVGKSTIASNLAGYFSTLHQKKISFIDYDRQGSGATLIKKIHDQNIQVYKKELFFKQGSNWSLIEAKQALNTYSSGVDIVIADLTWTFGLPYDFLLGFDLIIVPSSDTSLEVASTEIFILEYFQKNMDKLRSINQSIIVVPSRIDPSHSEVPKFSGLDFLTSCSIAPPIYRIPSIDRYYEEGFLCASADPVIAENFLNLGKFVHDRLEFMSSLIVPAHRFHSKPASQYQPKDSIQKILTEPSTILGNTQSNQIPKKIEIPKEREFSYIPNFLRRKK